MPTSQLNSVGTEVSTGIYLTLWISLCFIDPSLLGLVAEIMVRVMAMVLNTSDRPQHEKGKTQAHIVLTLDPRGKDSRPASLAEFRASARSHILVGSLQVGSFHTAPMRLLSAPWNLWEWYGSCIGD